MKTRPTLRKRIKGTMSPEAPFTWSQYLARRKDSPSELSRLLKTSSQFLCKRLGKFFRQISGKLARPGQLLRGGGGGEEEGVPWVPETMGL